MPPPGSALISNRPAPVACSWPNAMPALTISASTTSDTRFMRPSFGAVVIHGLHPQGLQEPRSLGIEEILQERRGMPVLIADKSSVTSAGRQAMPASGDMRGVGAAHRWMGLCRATDVHLTLQESRRSKHRR